MIPTKTFQKALSTCKILPEADNFTHALHVMHVTNIMSEHMYAETNCVPIVARAMLSAHI